MNTFLRKNTFWLAVVLAASTVFSSCSKNTDMEEGETVTKDYIMVEDNQSFSANTTSYLLNVQSNCAWTMAVSGNWDGLSFDRTSAESTGGPQSINIVITTSKNNRPDDRSCTLVFSNSDGSFKRTVTLTQNAGDFVVELDVDPTQINVIATGDTKTFKVECNTEWTVEVNKDATWCIPDKVKGTERETVTLTIQQNQTPYERVAQITVASGNTKGNKKEMLVTVTQSAATVPSPVVTEAKVSDDLKKITCKATLASMYDVTEYGYCIGLSENPTEEHQIGTEGGTSKNFNFTISDGIEDGRTYYIRAYAKSVVGIGYSENYPVTVKGDIPGNDDNNKPKLSR